MKESTAREIVERALSYADAEHVEIGLNVGAQAVTRLADNLITQNVSKDDIAVQARVAFGKSHGSAVTSDLSEDALRALLERAQSIARLSPADEEYMPPLGAEEAKKYLPVDSYHQATADYQPLEKAKALSAAASKVAARKLRLSGAYRNGDDYFAMGNSRGLRAFHRSTIAEAHMSVLGENGSGWAESMANDNAQIDINRVVMTAMDIAERSAEPQELAAGKYDLIIPPAAVSEMLGFMLGGLDAKATDQGRTFLRGKLGKKVCGENITIRSNPADPRCPSSPFQGGGQASQAIDWIRDGVLANLAYSRFWAGKQGRQSTGWPSNIIMEGSDTGIDEMVAKTERGIVATRFWYIRFVDPMVPSITGMTRDGLFLVENGKVTRPIKNMRFNESLLDLLSRVETVGKVERTGEWLPMLVPALKVNDFNFTSTTKF
jgi:predicted Zn-dependent protease